MNARPQRVVAEYSNGVLSTEYIYAGSQMVAVILNQSGNVPVYFHPDHLSSRLNTDASGNLTRQFGHYPFGESWYETASSPWKFTSYDRDSASGLDYAIFRYHSSHLGRFQTPDPLAGSIRNPQSLNRYAYVLNDPVNLIDPLGLAWRCVHWYTVCTTTEGNGTKCKSTCTQWEFTVDPPGADFDTAFWGLDYPRRGRFEGPPPCTAPGSGANGGGFGVIGGATGAAGIGVAGAAATGSVAAGLIADPNSGVSGEAFTSAGALAYAGAKHTGVPQQGFLGTVVGAFLGGGGGFFATNAGSVSQMSGPPAQTVSVDAGYIVKASLQTSTSPNGVWTASLTLGPGFGLSVSRLNTETSPLTESGCQ